VLCEGESCHPLWSADGNKLYISFAQIPKTDSKNHEQTYVIPWNKASSFNDFPPGGTRTEADVAKVATVVPAAREAEQFAPGPSSGVYAFSRRMVHRNLYKISLP
jgi:hypothetical protein